VTTILVAGALIAVFGLVLWAAVRNARQAGQATEQAKEAGNVVKAAERVADATAGAPRTVDDLDKRLQSGGHL